VYAVGIERLAHLLGQRPELDRDLALVGGEDVALALEHVHDLVVRNAIRVLPHPPYRLGTKRGRGELDRGVANALRERRREHVAALRERLAQELGNVDVLVQLVDDSQRELGAQCGLLDQRADGAHVRIGIEHQRSRPHRDDRDERKNARENDECNRTDRAHARRSECWHSAQDRSAVRLVRGYPQ
jgi:hypothetical protein